MRTRTPGPWRVGDAGHAVFGPPGSGMYPNAPITVVQNIANKANARLIAAAPELLDVAKKALADCCDLIATEAGNALEAAIAKAEGK